MDVEKYATRIASLNTMEDVRNFRANADAAGRDELVALCDERLVQLGQIVRKAGRLDRGIECAPGSVEDFILRSHERYEAVRSAQKGQKFTASRTWQMFQRHGIVGTCERVVGRPEYSAGFAALVKAGEWASAWEVIVLAFPDHFSGKACAFAHQLIHEHVPDTEIEAAIRAMRAEAAAFRAHDIAADLTKQFAQKLKRFARVEVRLHQAAFREAVYRACNGKCVISNCDVPEALKAAHLAGRKWRDGHNTSSDGILLRRDLHSLYDAGLIAICDGVVQLDSRLGGHYQQFDGILVDIQSEPSSS
ncbi:HNH endonuclease [Paraburkholderia sp. UCT31]|uniref:HNH endonuclease signature motif containing protein n=1 Tax=Paraburkholderia sp. UCT31 TaxID=2615209 RepID=UPI0016560F26|nr:HNH endonuclease signature motif containing protein [Paraburkholderia sp. UCT31]MBC8742897.1 HNH endonuclease [Paraburkholderia sp. UCT31]